jgi:hydroxyacid-oxoacid transhydrogenase
MLSRQYPGYSPTRYAAIVDLSVRLSTKGIDAVLFDQVSVEPTGISMKHPIAFATEGNFDGYVAVGGGSSIDTAKTANLYATYPADFLTYVNEPIGEGRLVPGPLKP